jgi:hypothetical protein
MNHNWMVMCFQMLKVKSERLKVIIGLINPAFKDSGFRL